MSEQLLIIPTRGVPLSCSHGVLFLCLSLPLAVGQQLHVPFAKGSCPLCAAVKTSEISCAAEVGFSVVVGL